MFSVEIIKIYTGVKYLHSTELKLFPVKLCSLYSSLTKPYREKHLISKVALLVGIVKEKVSLNYSEERVTRTKSAARPRHPHPRAHAPAHGE